MKSMLNRTTQRVWAIEHVNSGMFMARFNEQWVRTDDPGCAVMFQSDSEAHIARAALLQEVHDRIGNEKLRAGQMWWDIYGGLVRVVELEISTLVEQIHP